MTLEGKMTLTFLPPNYDKDFWENHPNLVQINELLGIQSTEGNKDWEEDLEALSEDEEEEALEGEDEEEDNDNEDLPPASSLTRNKFDLLMDDDQN
jgi:hypothetical protein